HVMKRSKNGRTVRAAVVQGKASYLDLEKSLRRIAALCADAAGRGARLIAFGETWLPGYPAWIDFCSDAALWDHKPVKEVFRRLRQNSVVVGGPAMLQLGAIARKHRVTMVVGVNERIASGPGNGTLYNALLTFTPDGKLANHHRKLIPTYTER